jgi:hypothetical protein
LQMLKTGLGRPDVLWPAGSAICTVTSSAVPPSADTSIEYSAFCPGYTEGLTAVTVMQISVGFSEGGLFADEDGEDPVPVLSPPPGEIGGVALEEGAEGSVWHWAVVDSLTDACEPARAAAVVPAHTTATPANTANTDEPARLPRRGMPELSPSHWVILRFSIIG